MNFNAIPGDRFPEAGPIKVTEKKRVIDPTTPEEIKNRIGNLKDPIHSQIKGALYKFGMSKYPNDREDLYQIVILKILKRANSFRGNSTVSSWIFRIAQNAFLDFIRKNKTRDAVFDLNSPLNGEEGDERVYQLRQRVSPTETEIINSVFMGSLLKDLSSDERAIIEMKKAGLSSTEIAKRIGITKSTFTTRFGVLINKIKNLEK
jgi:RNA polymerase sigma-70 factor (ECF subfamily)